MKIEVSDELSSKQPLPRILIKDGTIISDSCPKQAWIELHAESNRQQLEMPKEAFPSSIKISSRFVPLSAESLKWLTLAGMRSDESDEQ
jgi:hypothetical protein